MSLQTSQNVQNIENTFSKSLEVIISPSLYICEYLDFFNFHPV